MQQLGTDRLNQAKHIDHLIGLVTFGQLLPIIDPLLQIIKREKVRRLAILTARAVAGHQLIEL